MSATRTMLRHAITAVLVLAPALASAQGPVSTGKLNDGTIDLAWQVSVNGGKFNPAFLVTSPPGSWVANSAGNYAWIGASASGSLTPGTTTYVYQTTFGGIGVTSATFVCAVDNGLQGITLNGSTVSGSCGVITTFGSSTTLTGFAPSNVLQFTTTGDGTTDGLLVNFTSVITGVTTTPEPASVLLLGTGLLGIAAAVRRRRATST